MSLATDYNEPQTLLFVVVVLHVFTSQSCKAPWLYIHGSFFMKVEVNIFFSLFCDLQITLLFNLLMG